MSDHPLRLTIEKDLRTLLSIGGHNKKRVDQILERLATAMYPVMRVEGVAAFEDKICIKCHKYHKDAEVMGDGVVCPPCREKSTYKPKYTAKVMRSVGTSKGKPINICIVKGETMPDLWANFYKIGMEKNYPHFSMSKLFKTHPDGNPEKWEFLFMVDGEGKMILNPTKGEK